jgi:hypothetical protein
MTKVGDKEHPTVAVAYDNDIANAPPGYDVFAEEIARNEAHNRIVNQRHPSLS